PGDVAPGGPRGAPAGRGAGPSPPDTGWGATPSGWRVDRLPHDDRPVDGPVRSGGLLARAPGGRVAAVGARAAGEPDRATVALLGRLARDADGQLLVDVRGFCPARGAEATAASVRFTQAAWTAIHQEQRRLCVMLGLDLSIVAWVHSHPRIETTGLADPTSLFL